MCHLTRSWADAPGLSADAPGYSADAPGYSADAPGYWASVAGSLFAPRYPPTLRRLSGPRSGRVEISGSRAGLLLKFGRSGRDKPLLGPR